MFSAASILSAHQLLSRTFTSHYRCQITEDKIEVNLDGGMVKQAAESVIDVLTAIKKKQINGKLSYGTIDHVHHLLTTSPSLSKLQEMKVTLEARTAATDTGPGMDLIFSADSAVGLSTLQRALLPAEKDEL